MKHMCFILSLLVISFSGLAHNHGSDAESSMADIINLEGAWARETFSMAKSGAAYLNLNNPSGNAIHLVSASVDASVAAKVEIHTTKMHDGMMQMQELEQGLVVNAGESVMLQPGGIHIMLMGLESPLVAGQSFDLSLSFSDGSVLVTNVSVKNMSNKNADAKDEHKHHMHHH